MITSGITFAGLVGQIVGLIDKIIPVLGGIALVLFLIGGVRYVYDAGDAHAHSRDREVMIWGIIALFVLVSIWGILQVLELAFLGGVPSQSGAIIAPPGFNSTL